MSLFVLRFSPIFEFDEGRHFADRAALDSVVENQKKDVLTRRGIAEGCDKSLDFCIFFLTFRRAEEGLVGEKEAESQPSCST